MKQLTYILIGIFIGIASSANATSIGLELYKKICIEDRQNLFENALEIAGGFDPSFTFGNPKKIKSLVFKNLHENVIVNQEKTIEISFPTGGGQCSVAELTKTPPTPREFSSILTAEGTAEKTSNSVRGSRILNVFPYRVSEDFRVRHYLLRNNTTGYSTYKWVSELTWD